MPTHFTCAAFVLGVLGAATTGCASAGRSRGDVPVPPAVTMQDIDRNAGRSIIDILQAKAPGLVVMPTGNGGISLQIRGPSTFLGSNEPLFVIDDVPVQPGHGGALVGVNPYDIESIRVLKNPADIAIYGVRGANGVIVIRTKKPGLRDG